MKTGKIAVIFLGLGLAAAAVQPAIAQSGLEASKELSRPPLSRDLFKDNGTAISPAPPVDTKPLSAPAPAAAPTSGIDPFRAEGGPLTLLNCGSSGISVNTFNSNDGVMWVPFQTVNIGSQRRSGLRCATSSCKLHIGGLKTGAVSGYQVFFNGRVRGTNSAAMDKGCSVYR